MTDEDKELTELAYLLKDTFESKQWYSWIWPISIWYDKVKQEKQAKFNRALFEWLRVLDTESIIKVDAKEKISLLKERYVEMFDAPIESYFCVLWDNSEELDDKYD
jgi:hypothetical protein